MACCVHSTMHPLGAHCKHARLLDFVVTACPCHCLASFVFATGPIALVHTHMYTHICCPQQRHLLVLLLLCSGQQTGLRSLPPSILSSLFGSSDSDVEAAIRDTAKRCSSELRQRAAEELPQLPYNRCALYMQARCTQGTTGSCFKALASVQKRTHEWCDTAMPVVGRPL